MAENKFENLSRFAVNLNERAAQGKLDPVIGRDEEIRRVLQILSRRTKNNPILVGEPGVGKTAISQIIFQKPQTDILSAGGKYLITQRDQLGSLLKELLQGTLEPVLQPQSSQYSQSQLCRC